jgi:hypothetical protein
MRKTLVFSLIASLLLPSVSLAWNATGHKIISTIAYRQLDEAARKRVADALKSHRAYEKLRKDRNGIGANEELNLFWDAALFPDNARGELWRKYNRPAAHYVNYRIMGDEGNKVLEPIDGENVINSYVAHLRRIRDTKASAEDRALHFSWVFHQEQDIHQPLHAVAPSSKALPNGDRGGNGVRIMLPSGRQGNLISYWDGAIGSENDPAAIEKLADGLIAEYPRDMLADELKRTQIKDWDEESVQISLKTVYRDLDPNIVEFADRPVAYDAEATKAARRRAATAGYCLAEGLKGLFATERAEK